MSRLNLKTLIESMKRNIFEDLYYHKTHSFRPSSLAFAAARLSFLVGCEKGKSPEGSSRASAPPRSEEAMPAPRGLREESIRTFQMPPSLQGHRTQLYAGQNGRVKERSEPVQTATVSSNIGRCTQGSQY